MTLTIGRCGLDVTLDDPDAFTHDGDQVYVAGDLTAASIDDVKVLRQQLLGHVANPDELVIPVTWTEDPTADGFYRLHAAKVDIGPAALVAGWFRFTATLERVPGYANPLAEAVLLGADVRDNDHSISSFTARAWYALPDVSESILVDPGGSFSSSSTTRHYNPGDDSHAHLKLIWDPGADQLRDDVVQFRLAPEYWYRAAATLTVDGRVVVGRQVLDRPHDWMISNGTMRVSPDGTDPELLVVEHWDPHAATWHSKTYRIYEDDDRTDPLPEPHAMAVLRNAPEEVAIRLSYDGGLTRDGRIDLDLSLRRGSLFVDCTAAGANQWTVERATTEAASAITGGVRAASLDGAGNRYVIATPHTFTADTTNGGVQVTGPQDPLSFGIGMELATGGGAGGLIESYHAPATERLTTVGR